MGNSRTIGVLLHLVLFALGPTSIAADSPQRAKKFLKATECDRIASHPYDYERIGPPVLKIQNLSKAKEICSKDLAEYPENPRLLLLLGRVLHLEEREYWKPSPGLPYFQKSAAMGYTAADFVLGAINSNILGRGRFRLAFSHMLKAARSGHLEAMTRICLFIGRRSAQNYRAEIFSLTQKAISLGSADAMANLARAYIFILADTDRHKEAVEMLFEAERRGSLEASAALGQLQTFEAVPAGIREFLPENTFGGLRRLIRAADKGSQKAAFVLGILYSGTTFSIPRDNEKMVYWLCKAGRGGHYMIAELLEKDSIKFRCKE